MQSLNVLVSAYACRPGEGSEPGIGWDTVQELAKYHKVWVLTRSNNQAAIAAELRQHPLPNVQFLYIDLPAWAVWWKRGQRGVQIHYYLWQILAYQIGKKLHQDVGFDLIHHVTYVKYWGPSFLALLPVPFVWGPVGGGESAPAAFWQDFSWRGKLYEIARNVARRLAEYDPFVRMTARNSVYAWATTEDTAQRLRSLGAEQVEVYSQVGLSPQHIEELSSYGSQTPPLRFISIGRLLHWKGFYLGLRAFAQATLPATAEYWIVGDGPERQRLETLAAKLGIAQQVKFLGKLSRQETFQALGQSRVLVHPSLHESGGMVCLEAMAIGRPVICLDLGGPAVQVTQETGFKITAQTPTQVVTDMASVMTALTDKPEAWEQMSHRCLQRVRATYSWETKGKRFIQVYEDVVPFPLADSSNCSLV